MCVRWVLLNTPLNLLQLHCCLYSACTGFSVSGFLVWQHQSFQRHNFLKKKTVKLKTECLYEPPCVLSQRLKAALLLHKHIKRLGDICQDVAQFAPLTPFCHQLSVLVQGQLYKNAKIVRVKLISILISLPCTRQQSSELVIVCLFYTLNTSHCYWSVFSFRVNPCCQTCPYCWCKSKKNVCGCAISTSSPRMVMTGVCICLLRLKSFSSSCWHWAANNQALHHTS